MGLERVSRFMGLERQRDIKRERLTVSDLERDRLGMRGLEREFGG